MNGIQNIVPVDIEVELKQSFLDYSMSVIISRALPDVRDGLKPVHRRILYTLHDLSLSPTRPYRKCAKICGDVSGNYHPHGEAIVYGGKSGTFTYLNILSYMVLNGSATD